MNDEMNRNYATIEEIFDVLAKGDVEEFGQEILTRHLFLTEEEKCQLIKAARSGDCEALNQVVCAETNLAVSLVKQYVRKGVHTCVLIENAVRGIIDAVGAYDPDEPNEMTFGKFAVAKMRERISALFDESKKESRKLKITKTITERSITESENMNEQGEIPMPHLQLNDFERVDEDMDISSIQTLKKMADAQVQEKLSCLTDREREVMQMLIGHGCASMTVNEVADHFELLPSRIRQIRDKAMKKINSADN